MPKTFVIGDIHGAYPALVQCLNRSGFDYAEDHLICLGDVTDGWPDTKLCIEKLLEIKNLTYIIGNHDLWTLAWMTSGFVSKAWPQHGGEATMKSYKEIIPPSHVKLLEDAYPYYVKNNLLFVHAGFDITIPIENQGLDVLAWDRNLAQVVLEAHAKNIDDKITHYDEVYIGHTPISFAHPIRGFEVWMMDTGAGWSGVLSIMNIHTKEVFVSDPVPSLYPGVKGRGNK